MQKPVAIENALKRRYPEPVALVVSADRTGRANVMAVGWMMLASSEPWMFALGIDEAAYTFLLIRKTREFVVAFPTEAMAGIARFVGTRHGNQVDKFAETGLRVQPASLVRPPLLADAVANFECRLVKTIKPGDCPILFGEIVAAHANTNSRIRRLYNWGKNYTLSGARAPYGGRKRGFPA